MRTRKAARRIALAVLISVAASVTVYLLLSEPSIPEPTYNGTGLSEWLEAYDRPERNGGVPTDAELAIRAMGTNALPFLLASIRYELPAWRQGLLRLATFRVAGKDLDEGKTVYGKSWIEGKKLRTAEKVEAGFVVLNTTAAAAIPALEALMKNNHKPVIGRRAIYALAAIGPPALPALTNALADVKQTNRVEIIYAIYGVERDSPWETCRAACLAALTRAMNDPDPEVRRQAAVTRYNIDPTTLAGVSGK